MKLKLILSLILTTTIAFSDSVRFYFENDAFFDDDSDYTNGARLEYQHDKFNIFVEQRMYSPESIRTDDYVMGYHPYVGFIGIGSGYTHIMELNEKLFWDNYFEIETGMVGPSSHAEETQRFVHKVIGAHNPQGWKHQLHDEWEIQGVVWTGLDYLLFGNPDKWNIRIGDEIGGYVGTVQNAIGNNVNLKLCYNGRFNKRPGNIEIRSSSKRPTTAYLLVGNETRWWGWNVFLDGNRDGNSYSVEKEIWTTSLKTGLGLEYGRFEFNWFVLFNSREYKTQTHTPNYMSFQMGCRF